MNWPLITKKSLKIKEWLPNLVLLAFSVLTGLIIFEVYLRYAYHQKHQELVRKYQDIESTDLSRKLCTKRASNPDLIYTFVPNKCGANSQGYFDHEYRFRKSPEVFRIIVIGDSVAQGLGLDREDNFGKILEKKLNSSFKSKKKVEVVVLARSGYSTSQELIILKDEALKYEPDLIIWSYVLNDPAHPVYHNANGELGRYFFEPKVHVFNLISNGVFAINEAIKGLFCSQEYHQKLHCVYWDEIEANIAQIGEISQQNKIPVFFLIHPIFPSSDLVDENNKKISEYSLANLHRQLTELAAKEGLIPIDIVKAYENYTPAELKQQPEDFWHPNKKGHQIIADFIEQSVISNLKSKI